VGVSSDIIQRLLEREWIKKIGEKDVPGRPSLFGTTPEFLAYFNLISLKDLPELHEPRELDEIARDLGLQTDENPTSQEAPELESETAPEVNIEP
jgi:segregation and condensation protein B